MAKNKPVKVIIDTNLWISFIISNKQNLLDAWLFTGKLRLLFSTELIDELRQTIKKPKLKKYFGPDAIEEMLLVLEPFIDLVKLKVRLPFAGILKTIFYWHLQKMAKLIIYFQATRICWICKNLGRQK